MKYPKPFIAAILIFIGCLFFGFRIAQHKVLWTDEFYSQIFSVYSTSYGDQFLGHIPEGGSAPLFYSLQKLFLQVIHYQTPPQWLRGHVFNDTSSQTVLRITPVIFMSLSITLVFYYFCERYSLGIGFVSLFAYFSSAMLWSYWAEARPYALLVFLTTVQSVIFLKMMEQKSLTDKSSLWVMLAGINILLSLTSILSLGEILAVSVLWWAFKERDWKKYIAVTVLPTLLVLFYYTHAPRYEFFFNLSPEQLIRENIPRQRFDILFIFFVSLLVYFGGQRNRIFKGALGEEILKPVPYVIFMVLVLAASAVVLCLFALHANGARGFPISSRYFIYLMPIGVIATTMMAVSLVKSLNKYRLIQWVLVGLIGFLLAQCFFKILPKVMHTL